MYNQCMSVSLAVSVVLAPRILCMSCHNADHLKLLNDFKPNYIVLIVKKVKIHLYHKSGSKYKRICWKSNPKRQGVSASPIPHT